MSQNLAPPPYEQIIESRNIFLDSQEASEYPDSNRVQWNFENPITIGTNEKVRLSTQSIYGSRPFTMLNQSNRYYYMILSTSDGEYFIRQALDTFDYQSHYTIAYKFIESIKNPSQRRTIVGAEPTVATDSDVASSNKFDRFNIYFQNSVNNAVKTLKENEKSDKAFERKIFATLQNFAFDAKFNNSSGNGKVYSFSGTLDPGNSGFTKGTINFVEFLFPSSKKFSTIYDLQDFYLLAGGKREIELDPTNGIRYNSTGLVSSRVSLPTTVNLSFQNNAPTNTDNLGNIGDVLVQDSNNNNVGSGKGFEYSLYELEINTGNSYTFNLDSFRGYNVCVGFASSFYNDGLIEPTNAQNLSMIRAFDTKQNENIKFYHPFDSSTANSNSSTITFDGNKLNGARIIYLSFKNNTLNSQGTTTPQSLRDFLETDITSYSLPLTTNDGTGSVYINQRQIISNEFQSNFAFYYEGSDGKLISGGSFVYRNYIFDRTSSGVESFYEDSNGDLYKNNVRIQKGLFTEKRQIDDLYISSKSSMTLVSQPHTYLRATGGSGNLANSLFNSRASPITGISNSQIVARASNQEDIMVYNNNNASPDNNPTGFFVEITDSNLNSIEIELTDQRGRNIVNSDWSFYYGPLYINMLVRLDKIKINKQQGVKTSFEERDGFLNKNKFMLDSV